MYFEEVKYYLTTPLVGRTLLGTPPMGWNEDNKELVRSTNNWGVFTQLSNSLEFVNDGAEILNSTYEALGTEAEVILERVLLTQLNGEELDYRGHLDLKTYVNENDRVKVEFLTGGLQSLIESQFNEEFEIDRQTDINGNEIGPIEYKNIQWSGRKIFLQTFLKTAEDAETDASGFYLDNNNQGTFEARALRYTAGFDNDSYTVISMPMTITAESDNQYESTANIQRWYVESFGLNSTDANPLGIFLFGNRNYTCNININVSFLITFSEPYSNNSFSIALNLIKYTRDVNDNLIYQSKFGIANAAYALPQDGIGGLNPNEPTDVTFENATSTFQVEEGDLFVLGFVIIPANAQGSVDASLKNINADVVINEDSVFPTTDFNTIRVYDVGERLMQIISGNKNRFKSQFFGKQSDGYSINSEFEKTTISSGEVIRNIPDGKITISLKDVFELNNYFNLGWGVERFGAIEKMVIEPKEYFFQNKVGIELGEVSNFKISVADEFLYKSLGFGNDKAGDYEEIQGRSEYNTYNTFTTPLKTADDEYDVSGKVRADLIGAELARRKQYDENPNEDTRYDKENFIFSVKDTSSTSIELRTWQDDFESEPIVYDPDSAGNLLLTPFRSMQRHANFFKCGMIPYSLDFIRYASTKGNSNVATQLPNEPERFENGHIVLNELKPPIFKAEYYEFSFPTTHEIRKRLMQKIDSIPVPYFLITFTFREQTYSGWLINVSLNNEGNWKLIKNENKNVNVKPPLKFILLENGKTIKYLGNTVGDTGKAFNDPSGKVYTSVDRQMLLSMNPATDDYTTACTTLVTDMSDVFNNVDFNQNIDNWDVSNVTNMQGMFARSTFNQNINVWDVSSLINMNSMFILSDFNQPLDSWDVSNVTGMDSVFDSTPFNQDISSWNTSSVITMRKMFEQCPFNQNIGGWNVSSVTNMTDMFNENSQFNQDISGWNVSNVVGMSKMFNLSTSFNQDLSTWCVEQIPTEPTNFATGATAWVLPKPNWGSPC